jgi:aminoglycoside phosphotransferase (APT) family kinase protein
MSDLLTQTQHDSLVEFLARQIEGFEGPLSLKKFAGGQSNPTYLLDSKSGKYVLRRKPPGVLLESAHAVDREFRVLKALQNTEIPTPTPYVSCSDASIVGGMFYVMSYEPGRVFRDPALPDQLAEERTPVYAEAMSVLAALHSLDPAVLGLADFGRPSGYFERQLSRWIKQYRAAQTEDIAAMELLIEWLKSRLPEDDGSVAIIHGDYKLDNLLFSQSGPSARALLDWELSTLGHPMADLAYFCMCLRIPPSEDFKGLGGLNRAELHIPEEHNLIELYCEYGGAAKIEHWPFYMAFSFFRLAAIAQGVLKRALDGNAASDNAAQVGKMTTVLSQIALETVSDAGP